MEELMTLASAWKPLASHTDGSGTHGAAKEVFLAVVIHC